MWHAASMLQRMALLGRERELALLAEAVRRVAEGRSGRVVLTGPAGIGCTRLLDELCARVSDVPGITVARGRAYAPAMSLPYHAVSEALSAALSEVSDDAISTVVGKAGHDLCALAGELVPRLEALQVDRSSPSLNAPDQVGRRVLESILGTFERLAGSGVLLLVLEDIHYADSATRGLIEALQGVGRALPVCLVVSYQPGELHRRHPVHGLADRLADDPEVVRMDLGPMSSKELEKLVIDAAEDRPPGNVVSAVVAGAKGNPLVALRLAESASILEGVRLSDSFDQLCGARLEAMSRGAARVIRVMAVARMPLSHETVLSVQAPDGRLTRQAVKEAIESGLVVETHGRVAISHELIAEAIEAFELTPERKAIHASLAEQLHDTPAVAASHWARAARPSEARDAHIRAATAALQLDPGASVLEHYEEALELPGSEEAGAEERAAVLAGAAGASASAGRFRRAVALQRRAIEARAIREASTTRGHRDSATRLSLGEMYDELGRYQWAAGELDGAIDSMRRALGIMPDGPSRIRARALASLAQHLMLDGQFDESAQLARKAREAAIAAAVLHEDTLAERGHATCTLGVDAAYLGDMDDGLTLLEEASDIARRAGRLDDLMRAAANRTTLLDLDSRREEALEVVQSFLVDAEAGGLAASYGAFLRGNAADILYHLGRWQEAEAECRAALSWRMSALEAEWWPPLVLGLLLTESRDDAESARFVGQALLQLETVPAGQWTGHMIQAAVSQALWSGDVEGALSIAEREWARALESGELAVVAGSVSTCLEAAAAAADHGRANSDPGLIARARTLAERILPEAEAHIAGSPFDRGLGARQEADLSLATAWAHARRIQGSVDPEAWATLAEAWRARSMPYREAKASWWQALAILAAAREEDRDAARTQARGPLASAYRIARELPALPLLREVVDLGKRARVPLPVESDAAVLEELVAVGPGRRAAVAVGPGRPSDAPSTRGPDIARDIEERVLAVLRTGPADSYGLSPREREVLNIVAEGRTDRDIAVRLFISERTVHVHVRRILAKLGVSSRTEAAGVAIREGLVPATSGPKGPNDVASNV